MNANAAGIAAASEDMVRKAEEHADTQISQLKEEKLQHKKSLIKFGTMMFLIALVIIFATIAWFSMNQEVSARGMGVTAEGETLRIATKGEKVRYQTEFTSVQDTYVKGTEAYFDDEDGNKDVEFFLPASGAGGNGLILQYDTGKSEIGPGDNGALSLYIIPTQDGSISANITLDVIGYTMLEFPQYDDKGDPVLDANGDQVVVTRLVKTSELTAENTSGSQVKAADIPAYKKAEQFLRGHIMFFRALGDTAQTTPEESRYYYRNPVGGWSFVFEKANAHKDIAYRVPIYWMWPNTLGQIALRSATHRNGYPVVADSDTTGKAAVISYLKTQKSYVFYTAVEDSQIEDAANNFETLSTAYNLADFDIGTCIDYFVITVNVESAS